MSQECKVSVIVPCFRVEPYLKRCMDSLLSQTLREIEIILVDDQSPDSVPQMCDEYVRQQQGRWPQVHVVHKTNGGLGFARNSGLEVARGEFVAFVDGDDFVEPDMYATLYGEASSSGADVVFSNFFMEGQPGIWHRSAEVSQRSEWIGSDNVREFMLDMVCAAPHRPTSDQRQMSVWHSIYRRSVIEKHQIRFHSEREVLSEDYPFQMDFLLHASKVVYLPQSFYHYCRNTTSLTLTFSVEKFDRIRSLHALMSRQLADVRGSRERLDRFFITYVHARIDELILYNRQEALPQLKRVLSWPEWTEIQHRYPAAWLPLYPRLYYWLMSHRQYVLLILLSRTMHMVKRLRGMKA